MRAVATRRPLTTFFPLAFAFTWALLSIARSSIAISLLALCGPAAAALLTAALGGREQLGELRPPLSRSPRFALHSSRFSSGGAPFGFSPLPD